MCTAPLLTVGCVHPAGAQGCVCVLGGVQAGVLGCVRTHTHPGRRGTPPTSAESHTHSPPGQEADTPLPPVDRHTPVKTLPYPKLRLWAVKRKDPC